MTGRTGASGNADGDPRASGSRASGSGDATAASALAFTGSNTTGTAGIGLATVAAGAAAITVAAKLRRSQSGVTEPDAPGAGRHRSADDAHES